MMNPPFLLCSNSQQNSLESILFQSFIHSKVKTLSFNLLFASESHLSPWQLRLKGKGKRASLSSSQQNTSLFNPGADGLQKLK